MSEVFISYAWSGESEAIADALEQKFGEKGIKLVRDKTDLGYKGLIREFMQQIGQGKCVVAIVSDKYLKSKNCMFELLEISRNGEFYDRIFPIVLSDARIYDAKERLNYIRYWEGEIRELEEGMKTVSLANLQGFREEIDLYTEIRNKIAGLVDTLGNMNTLASQMHQESGFSEVVAAIAKRLEDMEFPPPNKMALLGVPSLRELITPEPVTTSQSQTQPIEAKVRAIIDTDIVRFETERKPRKIDLQRAVHRIAANDDFQTTFRIPLRYDPRLTHLIEKLEALYNDYETLMEKHGQIGSSSEFSNINSVRSRVRDCLHNLPNVLGLAVVHLCQSQLRGLDVYVTKTISRFIELELTSIIAALSSYQFSSAPMPLLIEYAGIGGSVYY